MPAVPIAALPVLLLALAAGGALDALFFLLVTYRKVKPDAAWLPRVCRMDPGTCARIVDTREARLLGPPNALFGLVFYALVAGAALVALAGVAPLPCAPLGFSALLAVLMSLYLAWALWRKLRVFCALCFLGHGINVALLAAIIVSCLGL